MPNIPQASAEFKVNDVVPTGAVAVAAGSTVTLELVSDFGVKSARWTVVGTHDPDATPPTIPDGVSTSFEMPAGSAQAYLVECVVNSGLDGQKRRASALRVRALIGVANAADVVPFAVGEKLERSITHGWLADLNAGMQTLSIDHRTIAGTSHTLELADRSVQLRTTSNDETTITIPAQSSVAWPGVVRVPLLHLGTDRLIIAGDGFTVGSKPGFEPSFQGPIAAGMLERIGEDDWVVYGDLEEST